MFNLFDSRKSASESPLFLHDSATGEKRLFTPLKSKVVSMYSCGPTVYNHIHIGNLRAYLLPDILKRTLLYLGYEVKHTINFTDFGHLTDDADTGEDKIMKGMKREGYEITIDNMKKFALPYIESFKADNEQFGNIPATDYTRATDFVTEQVKLIETLSEKGYTYETTDGIYYEVAKFNNYGQLGNINLGALRASARMEENSEKRHPADFALWKKSDLGFKSKWGTGFPGWHIECTAMAFATLGKQIDIHTGGEDLMYTHHNGEIAQAESVTGKKFSQFWLHNAHVTAGEEKLAKSAGNGFTLQDLTDKGFSTFDYRYWLLQGHYRTRMDFSFKALEAARQALSRLRKLVYIELDDQPISEPDAAYIRDFSSALLDDLDTPKVIATLWHITKDKNLSSSAKLSTIKVIDSVLNIGLSLDAQEGRSKLGFVDLTSLPQNIKEVLAERETARNDGNWEKSDQLREDLVQLGYSIKDTPEGTVVTKV